MRRPVSQDQENAGAPHLDFEMWESTNPRKVVALAIAVVFAFAFLSLPTKSVILSAAEGPAVAFALVLAFLSLIPALAISCSLI